MPRKLLFCLVLLVCSAITSACHNPHSSSTNKELLIYCGITMTSPMAEIAHIIEEQENCKVTIIKGGSGNLLKALKRNKVGDLYLPGSASYMETCLEEELVSESIHVGYNKAAILVQKGNPKNIPADLNIFLNPEYYTAIGNPDSGSIGREAKKILTNKGIFNEALKTVRLLTTDSKDLTLILKEKTADAVINWYATSIWPENIPYVDALPIDEKYAAKKKLILGLLKTSRYPNIAKKFMEYAASDKGRAIFEKYGLYTVQ